MKKGRPMRVAIVGAGRAGFGLARALKAAGVTLSGLAARRPAVASRAAKELGLPRPAVIRDLASIVREASVVLICVPDAEIPSVAAALADLPDPGVKGRAVLHASGAAGPGILGPLRERGAAVGCLHPLVSFPAERHAPIDLAGVTFAVDGDAAAQRAARGLVRALRGSPIRVAPDRRPAYHLAAALAANGTTALLDAAMEILSRRFPASPARARAALIPLLRSVLRNVERSGARAALTGPVARGDAGTVARHLEALQGEDRAVRDLYRLLSLRAVSMAEADGRLETESAAKLRRILLGD